MNIISSDIVSLRCFSRETYHELQKKYVADPIMDPNHYEYNFEKVEKSYEQVIDRFSWYKRIGIISNVDDCIIGEVSLKRIDFEKGQCEIGIVLANNSYKGLGYGSEAFQLSLKYATEVLKISTILADTMGSNQRMQRILVRSGFQLFGTDERYYDMGDRLEDRLNYKFEVLL
jgi:RimJ/RimL family protein N-acetyltransferase